MMDNLDPRLLDILRAVFREMVGNRTDINYELWEREFVFHMTECAGDLKRYVALCEHTSDYDLHAAERIVQGVLYHAVGHLISACRKYDYVPDPFRTLDEQSNPAP